MPILHIEKLRSGEGAEDEYRVVETAAIPRWTEEPPLTVVGRPHPRVEGEDKVTGRSGFPPAYAWVKLNGDGTADVVTGTQDLGTGTRTGLTQVAAEELGLPVDRIVLHLGDTAQGPYAP